MRLLFKDFGHHHEITVYDTAELYGEKGTFRVLQFSNKAVQGAMDLNDPKRILFEYSKAIIHLMEFNDPSFEDAFVIGHGIGTIAGHFADRRFKVAELDGKVVELSKQYFGYAADNVIVGDGRRILAGERPRAFDYIILDAFTDQGTPRHLISKEFFRLTGDKLASGGFIILNLMGRGENDRLVCAVHSTLCEEYAYTKSFSLHLPYGNASDLKNIIIMGGNKPIGFQERNMAGFTEFEPGQGYIITDGDL